MTTSEATIQRDKDRKTAWAAVRCAAAVGQAIRSRLLLTGKIPLTLSLLTSLHILPMQN